MYIPLKPFVYSFISTFSRVGAGRNGIVSLQVNTLNITFD